MCFFKPNSRLLTLTLSVTVTIALCVVLSVSARRAQSPNRIERAAQEPQNWLTYYGNYAGWSYSTLNQINRANVNRLAPVWTFPAGDIPADRFLRQGLEAAPLVIDGTLY